MSDEVIPDADETPSEGDLFRRLNGGLCRFVCYAIDDNTGENLVIFRVEEGNSVRVLARDKWEEVVWDNAGSTSQPRFARVR